MRFLTNFFSSPTTELVFKHLTIGLARAAGKDLRKIREKRRSLQCVKLTKNHYNVVQAVTYWCNLRINELQQKGISDDMLLTLKQHDARFLTHLAHSIAIQNDKEPAYDAWLFFHDDVQSTDFFELQNCIRGTKVTKASFVIQADR